MQLLSTTIWNHQFLSFIHLHLINKWAQEKQHIVFIHFIRFYLTLIITFWTLCEAGHLDIRQSFPVEIGQRLHQLCEPPVNMLSSILWTMGTREYSLDEIEKSVWSQYDKYGHDFMNHRLEQALSRIKHKDGTENTNEKSHIGIPEKLSVVTRDIQ